MERRELAVRSAKAEAAKGPIRRIFACPDLQMRDAGGATSRTLIGHAAIFHQLSDQIGSYCSFREKIQPGAFLKSLASRSGAGATGDVVALWQHLSWAPLARTSNGRLVLREDGIGLACEITPNKTSWGDSAVEAVSARDVTQMSFGFDVINDFWQTIDEEEVRTIVEADLIEVSPVTFPAYPQTDINARERGGAHDVREVLAAYESCRMGNATADDLALLRGFARDLAAAAGPTPDEMKRKLELEYHRRRLDLIELEAA